MYRYIIFSIQRDDIQVYTQNIKSTGGMEDLTANISITGEIWKSLKEEGFENYKISNLGRLLNIDTGRISLGIKTTKTRVVKLIGPQGRKERQLQNLVAKYFLANTNNSRFAYRINNEIDDFSVNNITWDKPKSKINPNRKGTARSIYQLNHEREIIKKWNKLSDVKQENYSATRVCESIKIHKLYRDCYWEYCVNYDFEKLYGNIKWKKLKIDDEKIRISETGLIRRKNGEITKGYSESNGYLQVKINKNSYMVHRLVAEVFLKDGKELRKNNQLQINHLDRNKQNNNYRNLQICTASENVQHAFNTNETKTQVCWRPVDQLTKNGQYIKTFSGASEAGRILDISHSNITLVCKYPNKHKTAGGFGWRYTPIEKITN